MNLLLPLGLLGLFAIPVILLIHIIKPKYHERTISSTYIWHLAKKYRKRKIPFEKLTQFFLILIQFLIVAMVAILLCMPLISTPNKIVKDQIILIDCSASMNTISSNGKTRYNNAVDKIVDSFSNYSENNKFTLIFVDSNPADDDNVYASSNRIELERSLRESGKCTFADVSNDQYNEAIEEVKKQLQQNKNCDVTIYSDHKLSITGDINFVNVADSEWNVALLDTSIELNDDSGYFDFKTSICSYNKDASVVVELKINNPYNNAGLSLNANIYTESRKISLKKNTVVDLSFDNLSVYKFKQASIIIREHEGASEEIQDAFVEDNIFYAYNGSNEKFKVELISESERFISAAINVLGTCENVVVAKSIKTSKDEGYDLYIYDGVGPTNLPTDGTVWIVNPLANSSYANGVLKTTSITTGKQNCVVNDKFTMEHTSEVVNLIKSNSFFVNKYMEVEYDETALEPCIFTESGKPLVLAGNVGLTKLCVLTFDLHYSNLPVTIYMPLLISNMMDYSVKRVVPNYFYDVGDLVEINATPSTEQINILHNNETIIYEKDALEQGVKYEIASSGVYTVIVNPNDKNPTTYSFFAGISDDESNFAIKHNLALGEVNGEEQQGQSVKSEDKDISIYFAIALLVLLVIEWGVQYREQY